MVGFIPQVPADVHDEVLFRTRGDFRSSLENIADHIARPAITGAPSLPMTFALYGQWGAGKSTALKLLEQLVQEKVGAIGSFTTTHYEAPLWERLPDVRATLAYEIVRGLASQAPSVLTRLLAIVADVETKSNVALPADQDLKEAIEFQQILQSYSNAPPLLEQWMRDRADSVVAELLSGKNGGDQSTGDASVHRVHTVFIDDLDRCGRQFTASLLAAITQWLAGDQRNLFFVLAVSRDHLADSIHEHLPLGPRYEQQALEKYVHLGVELPALLTTPTEVAEYLCALTDRVPLGDFVEPLRIEELKELLRLSARTYPDSVLAPLLRIDEALTPRSAKHRFNTFLAQFKPKPGAALAATDVKKWVLRAFWPTFWWTYLWDLEVRSEGVEWQDRVRRVGQLIELGDSVRGLWELGNNALGSALEALASRRGIDLSDIEPGLIAYIRATPPYDLPGQPPAEVSIAGHLEAESKTSPAGTVENHAFLLYLQADRAEDEHNTAEVRRSLTELRELTRQPDFPSNAAPTVGNAALIAERQDLHDIAQELHEVAVRLMPKHWNVLQNYVDFILGRELSDRYDFARDALSRLQTEGATHRPDRTRSLALRYAYLTNQELPEADLGQEIERMLEALRQRPTMGSLIEAAEILIQFGQNDAVLEASRIVAEAVKSDGDRYAALRLHADSLASRSREDAKAAEIYRFLIASGLACLPEGKEDLNNVKHNLAVAISSAGYTNTAALLWEEIYKSGVRDDRLRRSFAIHLEAIGRPAEAETVLLGQRLEPLQLEPENLPEHFVADGDRWWERLQISKQRPCPSAVLGVGD
jgi:KAP family P-loop domain